MLKNDSQVMWSLEAKKSFHAVHFALSTTPILIRLYYTSYFIIFLFTSEHTLATVLMQKKDQKNEQLISFVSCTMRDATLKHNIIEKQSLALVKDLRDFQLYILHSHTIAYVPTIAVKEILVQTDP